MRDRILEKFNIVLKTILYLSFYLLRHKLIFNLIFQRDHMIEIYYKYIIYL